MGAVFVCLKKVIKLKAHKQGSHCNKPKMAYSRHAFIRDQQETKERLKRDYRDGLGQMA